MGMKRLALYYKHRIGRLAGTPQFIAKGLASGVAISFTPFVGLHMIIGTLTCWAVRGSILAMVLGSLLGGNIWTLPLIWIATYKLGNIMLGHSRVSHFVEHNLQPDRFSLQLLIHQPGKLLLPMTLGCLPMVFVSWIVSYYIARVVVRQYQEARRHRIQRRRLAALEKQERKDQP